MLVADSTVWIASFRDANRACAQALSYDLRAGLAVEAATNDRHLRGLGVTILKLPDLIIGTFCIEHGHTLLHDDRDFEPMREHLGLRVA